MNKKVSLLIVSDGHPPKIEDLINPLMNQTFPIRDYEVIFISVHSSEYYKEAYRYVEEQKPEELKFTFLFLEDLGSRSAGYNVAIDKAVGEIILFYVEDFIAPRTLVESHYNFHQKNKGIQDVGVGQAFLTEECKTNFATWIEESGQLFGVPFIEGVDTIPSNYFYLGNTSLKKEMVEKTGKFNELYGYSTWEDFEYSLRLNENGLNSKLVAGAKSKHYHFLSLRERFSSTVRAGYSARFYKKTFDHPKYWSFRLKNSVPRFFLGTLKRYFYYLVTRNATQKEYMFHALINAAFNIGYKYPKLTERFFLTMSETYPEEKKS